MIPSKSSVISSLATTLLLNFFAPAQAFIIGAFIAPMPFYFFGLIVNKYPSKTAIISSLIVLALNRFGIVWWQAVLAAIVIGTVYDVWGRARTKA